MPGLSCNANQITVFMLTFMGYAGLHAMRTSWSYSKKILQKQDSINNEELGIVDMVFMLTYSIGLGFIGPLGDRFNRKYFIVAGYYTCALAFLVFPFCSFLFHNHSFWILVIFMGVNGLGESVGMPGSMGILSKWFKGEHKGLIVGMWAGCLPLGNIFGLMSSTIITQYLKLPWEYNFFFAGFYTITIATFILLFLKPSPTDGVPERLTVALQDQDSISSSIEEQTQKPSVLQCFRIPRVIPYVIAYSCLKSSIYGLLFWLPKYIYEQGMAKDAGYIPSMMDCGTFFGGIFIGYLGDYMKKRSLSLAPFIFFSTAMMLVALLFLSEHPLPYFFVIFFMGIRLGGPYNIIGTVIAIDLSEQECVKNNKKIISTITAIIDSSGALCTSLTQLLLANIPSHWIFVVFAIYTFIAGASLIPLTWEDFKLYRQSQKDAKAQPGSVLTDPTPGSVAYPGPATSSA
jgi:OPA family glycerol-3-phosphate transporter-like MFS transporter 3